METLSDKIIDGYKNKSIIGNLYLEEDVKEFIKDLKENLQYNGKPFTVEEMIDKLAGEKLI